MFEGVFVETDHFFEDSKSCQEGKVLSCWSRGAALHMRRRSLPASGRFAYLNWFHVRSCFRSFTFRARGQNATNSRAQRPERAAVLPRCVSTSERKLKAVMHGTHEATKQ